MRNTGTLFANDANADRAKAIVGNLHRLGVTNCIVSCMDGRKVPKVAPVFYSVPIYIVIFLLSNHFLMRS